MCPSEDSVEDVIIHTEIFSDLVRMRLFLLPSCLIIKMRPVVFKTKEEKLHHSQGRPEASTIVQKSATCQQALSL